MKCGHVPTALYVVAQATRKTEEAIDSFALMLAMPLTLSDVIDCTISPYYSNGSARYYSKHNYYIDSFRITGWMSTQVDIIHELGSIRNSHH